MKLIHAVVRTCGDCPFLDTIEQHIRSDLGNYPVGWFCLHKLKKSYVLEMRYDEGKGLRGWLMYAYGKPFPPDCPLPDAVPVPKGGGPRSLDLQPVVSDGRDLDKKS